MFWKTVGLTAATLTMFSFLPQIIKAARSRSVKDVSLVTLFQLSLGVCLWIAYGVHLDDKIIIMANIVTLITLAVLIYFYFSFKRPESK
ncbi:MAG: SemiSWEET family transporter [Candidatus Omnitrophota bacterium]|nr:hypothetical protein [Candidatus Omnitrophota bacterium]MBU1929458.1 hypothetical protein [Candidatus Omnitrophota bacterium]MBU2034818.1 hypothetical protein [Candidatus Omnitrophota bacterium]MBU2221173.1 hypothetical protein [Candidatus Omnitrophota bacterium]MBU2258120.1 hypothetical protein [Candidatus Omnitrophota bacterium]